MESWKKSKAVILPTEKESNIFKDDNSILRYSLFPLFKTKTSLDRFWNQHLYFLSDEQAKEGDWVLYNNKPYKVVSGRDFRIPMGLLIHTDHKHIVLTRDNNKKIIATTDESLKIKKFDKGVFKNLEYSLPRPSNEFLKKYCKLGGIDEIMIEYEEEYDCFAETQRDRCFRGSCNCPKKLVLKVAPDNTITIRSIKTTWTREEVLELCQSAYWEGSAESDDYTGTITFENWVKENL